MRRQRRRPLALVVLLISTACGDVAGRAPVGDEPQLTAVSVYGRHAAVRGKVDVRIANHGQAVVEVESYRVEHPMFASLAAHERRSTLPADGRARIVPVPFGDPRCDVSDSRGAHVVVGLRTPDGPRDVVVPLTDGEPGLVRAHRLACAVDAVARAVQLDLRPWSLEPGPVARTSLRLQRRGPGEIVVAGISGSILFSLDAPDGAPLLALPAGQDVADVQLQVRAGRCEAHALTESKTSTTFPVLVGVDGGEPVQVPLVADASGRSALQDLLDRTCGPAR